MDSDLQEKKGFPGYLPIGDNGTCTPLDGEFSVFSSVVINTYDCRRSNSSGLKSGASLAIIRFSMALVPKLWYKDHMQLFGTCHAVEVRALSSKKAAMAVFFSSSLMYGVLNHTYSMSTVFEHLLQYVCNCRQFP